MRCLSYYSNNTERKRTGSNCRQRLTFNSLNAKVAIIYYINQSIELQSESIDWFLYDGNFGN